jgi:hypothetical protein
MSATDNNLSLAAALLKGSIDTHIHTGPDVLPRKIDDMALARDAAKVGMKAVVAKCHVSPTEGRAALIQPLVPEVKIFGGLCLNSPIGGLNPAAVQISAKMGAKIIWMPTTSALNHVRTLDLSPHLKALGGGIEEKGITVLKDNGQVRNEVIEILEIIQKADIILATGHLEEKEILKLIEEALRRGVKKILCTHPDANLGHISIEEQVKLAPRGVFFERCWAMTTSIGGEKNRVLPETLAGIIKKVGPASTVMATDFGQVVNPLPSAGLREYIGSMLSLGISPKELETMVKYNPSQLLGL